MNKTRSIVLICLDSVRKDFFDDYASNVQDQADVSFEETRSASSWSVPSHASMITGSLPHEHGVHVYNQDFSKIDYAETFMSDMNGHRHLGVSANVYASAKFGFDKFFDELESVKKGKIFNSMTPDEFFSEEHDGETGVNLYFKYIKTALKADNPLHAIVNGISYKSKYLFQDLPLPNPMDPGAKKVLQQSYEQIEATDKPYFQFINLMDAHPPLSPHLSLDSSLYNCSTNWSSDKSFIDINTREDVQSNKEFIDNYLDMYSAFISYLDEKVSNFISKLNIVDNNTTVIVTSDHGLNMGYLSDNSNIAKKGSLSEGLLHVPMILINPPDGYSEHERKYFSHTKLPDLITGIANNRTPDVFKEKIAAERVGSQGVDGLNAEERVFWGRMIRCIYKDDKKIIWDSIENCSEVTLSVEACSYKEKNSIDCSEIFVDELSKDIFSTPINRYKSQAKSNSKEDTNLDASTKERLKNLGYI